MNVDKIRRYKEVVNWFTRDERIDEIVYSLKSNGVSIETTNHIKPINYFGEWKATKINILI